MLTTKKEQIMRLMEKIAWDVTHLELTEENDLYTDELNALRLLGHNDTFELIRYAYLYGYMRGREAK